MRKKAELPTAASPFSHIFFAGSTPLTSGALGTRYCAPHLLQVQPPLNLALAFSCQPHILSCSLSPPM